MKTETELLTPEEAAKILRISESTIRQKAQKGEIGKVKLGGKLLFSPVDLQLYIAKSRVLARR